MRNRLVKLGVVAGVCASVLVVPESRAMPLYDSYSDCIENITQSYWECISNIGRPYVTQESCDAMNRTNNHYCEQQFPQQPEG
jgi:hypothetical protein